MKNRIPVILCLAFAVPAFAGVTINNPYSGDRVTSPFSVSAYSSTCSGQPVGVMAYSIDSGSDIAFIHDNNINVKVSAGKGGHTVHVKSWGSKGAVCVTDVSVDVTGYASDTSSGSSIPSDAISVSNIEALGWSGEHDGGTNGSSSGWTQMVGSPAHSGRARQFSVKFSSNGGERYHASFGDNATSTNFFYDAWVYLTSSASHIGNLEMDLNQTISDGKTVIFGIQCDGWTGTWDYSYRYGWIHSHAACNPRGWSKYKWHHIQASYSRNSSGYVTYHYIVLDGHKMDIGATVNAGRYLGWGHTLLTNFQVDGLGSGSVTAYLDGLTIRRW